MLPYLLTRACAYAAVLAVAISLNFILPRLIPGNPIEELTGGEGSVAVVMDPQVRAALRGYYGLDRPLVDQFMSYVGGALRGDLGYSIHYRTAVAPLLLDRLPWTLFLTLSGLVLSFLAAILLGARSASGKHGEGVVLVPAVLLESMPSFVLGSILLVLLSVKLPLFPLSGAYTPLAGFAGWRKAIDLAYHAALPILVLATSSFFSAYLVVRNSIRLVTDEAYVLMAEMKGLPERTIRYGYVLRTALLPIVTFFGLRLATSAGGAIMVEVLFAYPGIGKLTYEAVLAHDYALLQGAFATFTLWVLCVNFLTDCLYVCLDPRVKEV